MKTLGEMIETKRKEEGFVLKEAADKISISRTTLMRLEKNHTQNVTINNFVKLANYLELDFFDMLKAWNLRLFKIDIFSMLKQCRKIYFRDSKLDKEKLEELITQNLNVLL